MTDKRSQDFGRALGQLRRNLGRGASDKWLGMVVQRCMELGHLYGGAEVLAWWLAERTMPEPRITNAMRARLLRMCGGSQKSLDLLVAIHRDRAKPRRLRNGWTLLDVTSYLTLRTADFDPQRYGVVKAA